MYPLLISGIASVASKLIDSYGQAADRKIVTEQAKFDAMLNRLTHTSAPVAATPGAAVAAPSQLDAARERLLNSPEVQAAINATDPNKPLSLNISEDGKVSLQSGTGTPREILLAPETLAAAREVGASLAGKAASSSIYQSVNAAQSLGGNLPATLLLRS